MRKLHSAHAATAGPAAASTNFKTVSNIGRHEEGTATAKPAAHEVASAGSHRLAVVEEAGQHAQTH